MKQQAYSRELRAEGVKMVLEQGMRHEQAAKRLSIPKGTLGDWLMAARAWDHGGAGGARSALGGAMGE